MKLLGADAVPGGVEKYWLHNGDNNKDRITVETVIDVEPLLKQNAAKAASTSQSFHGSEMHEVARFDGVTLTNFAKAKGMTFGELMLGRSDRAKTALNELLNSREFRAFRVKPGKVDVKRGFR